MLKAWGLISMDVKGIIEKVVAGLVGAAILGGIGWAAGKFSAPELPSIRADYVWMEVPNSFFVSRDPARTADLDKQFGVVGLGQFLGSTGGTAKIGKLTVRNASRVRSKQVEISAKTGGIFAVDSNIKGQELRKQVLLGSLDGEGKAEFIVLSDAGFYKEPSVKVIVDDKLIDVDQLLPDRNLPNLYDYVWIILVLVFLGATTGLILVLLIGTWFYSFYDPDIWLRNLSAGQVKDMVDKIEKIRQKFPEKLPKPEPLA
jgi:hypothetical protein